MHAIDIQKLTTKLENQGNGLWLTPAQREISYPSDGNESCLEIEENSFWFTHRNNVIISLVKNFAPDGPLFDVGGGNGYVAAGLERAGIDTILIEPGLQGARNAKARGLNLVIRSTIEDCEFRSQTIPAFGLFDVLEHVKDDLAFLKLLRTLLLPGGYLYVTVPAYNFLWSVDDDLAQHYRRYRKRTLTQRLESAGFTVKYCTYFFCILMPAVFLFRSLSSRLRIRRSINVPCIKQEHALGGEIRRWFLERAFAHEFRRIQKRKHLPAGSSCLAVAQKL